MRVYISGAMSGYSEKDITERFCNAERMLKAGGCKVFNPSRWRWFLRYFPYKVCLAFDIVMMCFCDRVYLLSGWTLSDGAMAEAQFARSTGMVIIYER